MKTVTNERLCTLCRSPLSIYNQTDRCLHHGKTEADRRSLFRIVKPVEIVKERGRMGKPVIELAQEVASSSVTTSDELLSIVAHAYGISQEEIMGDRRMYLLVRARQVLMYLLRTDLKKSLPEIGLFLHRDHTTIIHGCRQVIKKMETDINLVKEIGTIRSRAF